MELMTVKEVARRLRVSASLVYQLVDCGRLGCHRIGNYWRVSHEFLLLGVRGKLTFQDKGVRSWIEHKRTEHSRKPLAVRELVERVSPGPYLEMYGRQTPPNNNWTVYGNQVQ